MVNTGTDATTPVRGSSYWECSQQPLQALLFLLPLIVFYEVGLRLFGTDPSIGDSHDIRARQLLFEFFDWFGINAYYLPSLIVVSVLLSWHVIRREAWRIHPGLYGWMWFESLVIAAPLYVFVLVLFRGPVDHPAGLQASGPLAGEGVGLAGGFELGWQAKLIFSVGAGIYEELLFRLIGLAVLHMLLVDVLALPDRVGAIIAIAVSSLLFAWYHFTSVAQIEPGLFLYYTAAGVYLACLYLVRGFGIVVGTHAMFDILVVLL